MTRRQLVQEPGPGVDVRDGGAAAGAVPSAAEGGKGFTAVAVEPHFVSGGGLHGRRDWARQSAGMKVSGDNGTSVQPELRRSRHLAAATQRARRERLGAEGRLTSPTRSRDLGSEGGEGGAERRGLQAAGRYREQLSRQGPGRLRRADQRQGHDGGIVVTKGPARLPRRGLRHL